MDVGITMLSEPCGKVSLHTAHQLNLLREPYVRTGLEKKVNLTGYLCHSSGQHLPCLCPFSPSNMKESTVCLSSLK
ncbi:hypothetical protein AAHA92_06241 [Salvia divinorum]|uniref:Uncharacterized protein n=1 Tax=Salvia divinorum TaxID=28513 RepID=A0ABD1I5V8_SALDI